jgi:hypothetical protein
MTFKPVMRLDDCRVFRIGRFLWQRGKVGVAGGGYSAKFSVAVTPKLFAMQRGYYSLLVVLFGLRLHYQRSYGGIIV